MSNITPIPTPGQAFGGGFFGGLINIAGQRFALVVAPKDEGELEDQIWIKGYQDVPGAKSHFDGAANTAAMAEAGSELGLWARELRIDGHDDWYLPSQDELEIIYRNLKPTTDSNSQYARSGINLSAVEPTRPYEPQNPAQTVSDDFKAGGAQAFERDVYWTSTQHAGYSDCAWYQYFNDGDQDYYFKGNELRARAVRRLPI